MNLKASVLRIICVRMNWISLEWFSEEGERISNIWLFLEKLPIAQLLQRSGLEPESSMWDLWWTKRHWDRFLLVFRFLLPIIPPIAPHWLSSIIIRGWYNRSVVALVIVDSVPFHPKMGEENYLVASLIILNTFVLGCSKYGPHFLAILLEWKYNV
jgi:hypothetical protein